MAIEKTSTANLGFQKANVSNTSATDLENLRVSQNGPNLVRALSNTSFIGLTGDFRFINGQLQSLAFQIVNMNENEARRVGFWTTYSTSKSSLAPAIWAGDLTSTPKGWEIPTNWKKLQIGVPVNGDDRDFSCNMTTVTGYCVDIFDAVVEALPYAMTYQYIPFAKPDGKSAGTYINDLVYQVYLKKYDGVVGDTTIIANRSKHVDFTLPYTESGVSMIVPIKDNRNKNAWVFLKSLTWDLWATTFCFFVFIGFVVWVIEHRINEDFRGPPSHQAGTSFCKDILKPKLSRIETESESYVDIASIGPRMRRSNLNIGR
uniref:Ionotropic glutamate receptor C-terminal domain-containing protein n=1 Tax=Populus trichocarpa TaxID=3694 RepID=A0A2K1WU61_POPTR